MNREMREVERWNDPAAAFLTVSSVSALGAARRVSANLGSPHTLPSHKPRRAGGIASTC